MNKLVSALVIGAAVAVRGPGPDCPNEGVHSSDPGCVRWFKHNYRTACDRWHLDGEAEGPAKACNCFTRKGSSSGPSGVFVDCSNLELSDLNPPRIAGSSPTSSPTPSPNAESNASQTFPYATVFYANGNKLTRITRDTFGYQPELKYLYLHNNPNLEEIEPGAFSNMKNLRELLLHYTALKVLPAGIFDDLPALRILWVHNTRRLYHVAPGAFSKLESLKELRLENNNLSMSSLDYTASELWPASLVDLDLSGNDRLVFKDATPEDKEQACCAMCGFRGNRQACGKNGERKCGVRAENELPFSKTCKKSNEDCAKQLGAQKEQVLTCGCGGEEIVCGGPGSCTFETPEECQSWQLNVNGGAVTRARLIVTLAVSVGTLLVLW